MTMMQPDTPGGQTRRDDRTVGELFADLVNETSTLVRQEIKLATTEMNEKVNYAGRQVGYIALGALLGVVALLTLIGALVLGLATVIALWKSALIVGIVAVLLAVVTAAKGVAGLRDMSMVPKQTIETLKEDKQWVEEQVR
jgi:Putative Actinobacterial Holin-X, holin superfamily III